MKRVKRWSEAPENCMLQPASLHSAWIEILRRYECNAKEGMAILFVRWAFVSAPGASLDLSYEPADLLTRSLGQMPGYNEAIIPRQRHGGQNASERAAAMLKAGRKPDGTSKYYPGWVRERGGECSYKPGMRPSSYSQKSLSSLVFTVANPISSQEGAAESLTNENQTK